EIVGDRDQRARLVETDARLDLAVEGTRERRQIRSVEVRSLGLERKQELLLSFRPREVTARVAVSGADVLKRVHAVHVRRSGEHRDPVIAVGIGGLGAGRGVVVTYGVRPMAIPP